MPDDRREDYQWMDDLVDEAHKWVDNRRRQLGLQSWKWHRPKHHRMQRPLADLIKIASVTTSEENTMRHFSYACKHEGCDFVGQSTTGTNSLSEHYQSNPGHKHGHVPKSNGLGHRRNHVQSARGQTGYLDRHASYRRLSSSTICGSNSKPRSTKSLPRLPICGPILKLEKSSWLT